MLQPWQWAGAEQGMGGGGRSGNQVHSLLCILAKHRYSSTYERAQLFAVVSVVVVFFFLPFSFAREPFY